jgi:hypothetical protein
VEFSGPGGASTILLWRGHPEQVMVGFVHAVDLGLSVRCDTPFGLSASGVKVPQSSEQKVPRRAHRMYLQSSCRREVPMLRKEDFAVIKALHHRGVYQRDVAAELGMHSKTVSRALKLGTAPHSPRPPRGSKLDPYRA